jgi:hypothetical protein
MLLPSKVPTNHVVRRAIRGNRGRSSRARRCINIQLVCRASMQLTTGKSA